MAGAEFLEGYLKYDKRDMEEINITDTKISGKGDSILYLVLGDQEQVINIRRRLADCKNDVIKTRDYIPPQFFKRYVEVGKYAADQRSKYGNLKTQIRFTENDLQLLVKTKGSDEPFSEIKLEEIEKEVGKAT